MKKIIGLFLLLGACLNVSSLQARHHGGGGDGAVVGALGGLAVGTMIGTAAAGNSHNSRAEQKADQLRIEKEQERVNKLERQVDRTDLENKIKDNSSGNSLVVILSILAGLLILAVMGLLIVMFKKH